MSEWGRHTQTVIEIGRGTVSDRSGCVCVGRIWHLFIISRRNEVKTEPIGRHVCVLPSS